MASITSVRSSRISACRASIRRSTSSNPGVDVVETGVDVVWSSTSRRRASRRSRRPQRASRPSRPKACPDVTTLRSTPCNSRSGAALRGRDRRHRRRPGQRHVSRDRPRHRRVGTARRGDIFAPACILRLTTSRGGSVRIRHRTRNGPQAACGDAGRAWRAGTVKFVLTDPRCVRPTGPRAGGGHPADVRQGKLDFSTRRDGSRKCGWTCPPLRCRRDRRGGRPG